MQLHICNFDNFIFETENVVLSGICFEGQFKREKLKINS